eukprot:543859-Rhodomonas_salina.1
MEDGLDPLNKRLASFSYMTRFRETRDFANETLNATWSAGFETEGALFKTGGARGFATRRAQVTVVEEGARYERCYLLRVGTTHSVCDVRLRVWGRVCSYSSGTKCPVRVGVFNGPETVADISQHDSVEIEPGRISATPLRISAIPLRASVAQSGTGTEAASRFALGLTFTSFVAQSTTIPVTTSITPYYSHVIGGGMITVIGGPFVDTPTLQCRWSALKSRPSFPDAARIVKRGLWNRGLGFRVLGLGFSVLRLGFGTQGLGLRL